ncbi:MAG: ribonuclease P protein component [Nitrospira sp.]|nr:ribonuclease P protein component [Nitrospira sp.]
MPVYRLRSTRAGGGATQPLAVLFQVRPGSSRLLAPGSRRTAKTRADEERSVARASKDLLFFLKNSGDIERVKKAGCRLQTSLFNLVSCRSEKPYARVGVIVGKRLGGAVIRNRAKRIFRELARQSRSQLVPGRDMLVFPKHSVLATAHRVLRDMWLTALRQQALIRTGDKP